jgi:catechol 2,3-dioxygenase-like lactoylglutathione lyase family enzyme
MKLSVGAITLFVDDPKRSRAFYENAFALPPDYEDDVSVVFKFENTLVNLLELQAARGLLEPGAPAEAGSRLQLTIWVDDTNAACALLAERGVELLNGPLDRPWGVRTASFTDPDGHVWEVAQQLSA